MKKKMTETQKNRRAINRKKFWKQHIGLTIKADKMGRKGLYDACTEYRTKAETAHQKYRENGGR